MPRLRQSAPLLRSLVVGNSTAPSAPIDPPFRRLPSRLRCQTLPPALGRFRQCLSATLPFSPPSLRVAPCSGRYAVGADIPQHRENPPPPRRSCLVTAPSVRLHHVHDPRSGGYHAGNSHTIAFDNPQQRACYRSLHATRPTRSMVGPGYAPTMLLSGRPAFRSLPFGQSNRSLRGLLAFATPAIT